MSLVLQPMSLRLRRSVEAQRERESIFVQQLGHSTDWRKNIIASKLDKLYSLFVNIWSLTIQTKIFTHISPSNRLIHWKSYRFPMVLTRKHPCFNRKYSRLIQFTSSHSKNHWNDQDLRIPLWRCDHGEHWWTVGPAHHAHLPDPNIGKSPKNMR